MYFEHDRGGGYYITKFPSVEFVNPIEHDYNNMLNGIIPAYEMFIKANFRDDKLPDEIVQGIAQKKVISLWSKNFTKIMSIVFPDNFFEFLLCQNKKTQEKFLKNQHLTTKSLQAIMYTAWQNYGFKYSFYKFERLPTPFENKIVPDIVRLQNDNSIDKIGHTNMTDGELKSLMQQRGNVFAKFLDQGKIWHCFLYTLNSITGKEVKGTPHFHYISSAFGNNITREGVLNELKKGQYNLPRMLHINYTRYE